MSKAIAATTIGVASKTGCGTEVVPRSLARFFQVGDVIEMAVDEDDCAWNGRPVSMRTQSPVGWPTKSTLTMNVLTRDVGEDFVDQPSF